MCTCAGECVYMSSMCMCECVFIQTQMGVCHGEGALRLSVRQGHGRVELRCRTQKRSLLPGGFSRPTCKCGGYVCRSMHTGTHTHSVLFQFLRKKKLYL